MKRIIKGIFLFTVIVLSIVFTYPSNAYALTEQTSFVNINNPESLEVGSLSFSNILFRDYSSTSTMALGLTGVVSNSSSNTISYISTAYYYDSNYNLIAQGSNSGTAISGTSNFNQMSNLSVLGGHSVDEIYYYRLSINISDSILSENGSTSVMPSKNYQYSSYDYIIDKYDVNIIVNENNTFDITETITAYFNVSKHGIFRTIPLKNKINRLNGTTSTNRTQVTNISVDNEYTTSRENGNYKLKIGSASRTLKGEQTYVIKYTYNLGKDPVKDYDELYYNIIGNEWDTVIGNITFSITMPKEFDSSKLGFSSGTIGSTDNSKVKYNVSGNKITGSYNDILGVGEALTVRCELPEGYFVGAGLSVDYSKYILFILPIIFFIISLLIWYKYGKDDPVVDTVEFYPPEGLNSLDVGFLFKGKAETKDVTSLLIFLANKGYLEIINDNIDLNAKKVNLSDNSKNNANRKIIEIQNKINEEKRNNSNSQKIKYYENMLDIYKNIDTPIDYEQYGLKSLIDKINKKDKFLIRKLKDYDGTNINEQWFMEGLFEYDRTEVTDEMLYDNFYRTNNKILYYVNNKQNKIFEKSSSIKSIIIVVLMIISLLTTIAVPTMGYAGIKELLVTLLICLIYIPFFAICIFSKNSLVIRIFILCFLMSHSFAFFSILPIAEAITNDNTYLLGFIIGILCLIGMIKIFKLMPKRTKYGNEMLGKLKGFKNFLETVEKEKLEAMVQDNPNYFYDILPFTYVLDVSDKWIKNFESISLQAPSWYDSTNAFDVSTFGTFVNSAMDSTQKAMSYSPSSSSGGRSSSRSSGGGSSSRSSGGGSSGGGSGGGGGGSW